MAGCEDENREAPLTGARLPRWAPRVHQMDIRRLYLLDAQGICDDDLFDEVGYELLARCKSFIAASQAHAGRAPCPICGQAVPHDGDKQALLHCDGCGWELTWGKYFATLQHKQLVGAEPVLTLFRDFVARFPRARTPQEKCC